MGKGKGSKRRKKCGHCRDLFDPDPRTKGGQKHCSKPECQKVRQRKNEKDWRKRHPENQLIWVRLWNKSHSGYSANRRSQDSDLLQSNRKKSRVRMQKMRTERQFDKSKLILRQLHINKDDKCYLARGGWMILRLTKARSFTTSGVIGHTQNRLKRVANKLPKGRLYDLSEEILNQPATDP